MGLNRPHTEAEKQHKREMSKRFWASEAAIPLKEARGKRLGEWNKTRLRPEAERRASAERVTKLNKTRKYSEQERKSASDRMRARIANGWKRKPLSEEEREFHRQRMMGNTHGAGQSMSAERREWHRQRMLTNNPGIGAHLIANLRHGGPNKAEARLDRLIAPLGFRFVGDAKFWIGPGPSGLMRNPDWVFGDGKQHKIAVLHHGEYWHRFRKAEDAIALADYAFLGWQVLVIWEKENKRTKENPALVAKVEHWLFQVLGRSAT